MEDRLYLQERRDYILTLLDQQGRVSVNDLSARFSLSPATIRNDLEALAVKGLLLRTHGGAIPANRNDQELSFQTRQQLQSPQKNLIGKAAAKLIQPGDVIALDASTTALAVTQYIKDRRDLTVVTNGLFVALELLNTSTVKTLLTGGFVRKDSASLVRAGGYDIATHLERFHIQKAFVGAKGLTLESGLTDVDHEEVLLKQALISRSKNIIALVDSSKWGHVSFASFAPIAPIDCIITDEAAPTEMVQQLREMGTEVIIAGSATSNGLG